MRVTSWASKREGLAAFAVVALLVHAGSSLLRAIEGVWFTADLWLLRDLTPSDDIPIAAGAVGPPSLMSITAMSLSIGATLYAAIVLALWARAERPKTGRPVGKRQPCFIAVAWIAALGTSMLPSALIRGEVLDSALAAFRVSYWEATTSIGMLAVDLGLALLVAATLRRLRDQLGD
ncbi:MAG: hypothetical protein JF588_00120 [Caulobacterales bacterium]|nr:hypothetical protein [Caulobacterales bacterium]